MAALPHPGYPVQKNEMRVSFLNKASHFLDPNILNDYNQIKDALLSKSCRKGTGLFLQNLKNKKLLK